VPPPKDIPLPPGLVQRWEWYDLNDVRLSDKSLGAAFRSLVRVGGIMTCSYTTGQRTIEEAAARNPKFRPKGLQVRHLNGKPWDNRLDNLTYGTKSENEADKDLHGTKQRGSRHGQAKLTERTAATALVRVAAGESLRGVARDFGVTHVALLRIVQGRTWRHVPRPGEAGGITEVNALTSSVGDR
jgi:hypothetical protein